MSAVLLIGTFTGAMVGLIGQLGPEHRLLLSKHEHNLFPSGQYNSKRIHDEADKLHSQMLLLGVVLAVMLTPSTSKKGGGRWAQADWDAIAECIHKATLHLKIKA